MTLRHAPLPARRLLVAILSALLLAAAVGPPIGLAAKPAPRVPAAGDVIPGRLLVRFDPTTTAADKGRLRSLVGGRKVRGSQLVPGLEVVSTTLGADAAIEKLRGRKGVQYVEPDRVVTTDSIPDDPSFPNQWGLHNEVDTDINAMTAWDLSTGAGVVVAVVDSGVELDHPDLAPNIWTNAGEVAGNGIDDDDNGFVDDVHGWDFNQGDADPSDVHGHGTHVAGTIGAVGNNAQGVVGVAYSSRLMPVRMLGDDGQGALSHGIAAIEYAWRNGADVANLSWGMTGGIEQPLKDVIAAANSHGMVVVAAAGNQAADADVTPYYPAAFDLPGLISVGAIGVTGTLAAFSNFGLANVDIAAPGVDVLSTVPGGYGYASGTSMAAPHVTGAVALMLAAHPTWSPSSIRTRLLTTARPRANLVGKVVTGGLLDANAALRVLGDTPPTIAITSPKNKATLLPETAITFSGTATDAQDGNLSAAIEWTSNLQGDLGTGASIQRSDLVPGTHLISASAADSAGHTPSKTVTITIGPVSRTIATSPELLSPVVGVRANGTVDIAYQRHGTGTRLATKPPGGSWSTRNVSNVYQEHWVDLAIDPAGQPAIAVQREWSSVEVFEDAGLMMYRASGSTFGQERITDSCQDIDATTCHEDWNPALAFDSAGREHVVFLRSDVGLLHARRTSTGAWAVDLVSAATDVSPYAVAIGPSNSVHVAFVRPAGSGPGIYYATNASGTWTTTRLSTSNLIRDVGLVVDPAGGVRVVAAATTGVQLRSRTGTTWGAWTTLSPSRAGSVDIARETGGRLHIVFGRVDATDLAAGISYLTNPGGTWQSKLLTTTQSVEPSIALDALGRPHIAWREGFPTPRIRYATNATGSWVTTTPVSAYSFWASRMSIDPTGKAHVATSRHGTSPGVYYGTDAGGHWTLTRISSQPTQFDLGMATDAAGHGHVVYAEVFSANNTPLAQKGVYYATNATGTWQRTRIGNPGEAGPVVIDAAGHAHIAYLGFDDGPGGTALFGVQYATNASGSWVNTRVLTGGFQEPTIALTAAGKVHVAATLYANDEYRIFHATNASGSWTSAGLTSGHLDSRPSIAIRPDGQPSVSYERDATAVRLAELNGTSWTHRTVELGQASDFTELLIDPDGTRHVLISSSNLDYAVCPTPMCPDYPGVRHAIGGNSGPFAVSHVTYHGEDVGAGLVRAPDGSLRALIERPHVGLYDLTIEGATPD